jgi:hypothetical protein
MVSTILSSASGRRLKLENDIRQQIENAAIALETAQQAYEAAVLEAELDKLSVVPAPTCQQRDRSETRRNTELPKHLLLDRWNNFISGLSADSGFEPVRLPKA